MQLNYNAADHVPQGFDPLPGGWYNVKLVEGLETPVKNKPECTYYKAVFEVIDGQYAGRKLFHNFNFKNDNETAVKIAYDQLATIMHAVGMLQIQVMDQLFNKPLQAKVKLKAAVMEEDGVTEKYEAGNEIKGFKALEGTPKEGAGGLPDGFGDAAAGAGAGLPEGFTAGVETAAASTPAAAAASTPSVPGAPTAAAPAAPVKKLVMTDKAGGATAEAFRAHDAAWTDELLVKEGYAQWVEVAPEAPKTPAVPSTPSIPSTPAATAAASTPATAAADAATADDDETPPWLQQ